MQSLFQLDGTRRVFQWKRVDYHTVRILSSITLSRVYQARPWPKPSLSVLNHTVWEVWSLYGIKLIIGRPLVNISTFFLGHTDFLHWTHFVSDSSDAVIIWCAASAGCPIKQLLRMFGCLTPYSLGRRQKHHYYGSQSVNCVYRTAPLLRPPLLRPTFRKKRGGGA